MCPGFQVLRRRNVDRHCSLFFEVINSNCVMSVAVPLVVLGTVFVEWDIRLYLKIVFSNAYTQYWSPNPAGVRMGLVTSRIVRLTRSFWIISSGQWGVLGMTCNPMWASLPSMFLQRSSLAFSMIRSRGGLPYLNMMFVRMVERFCATIAWFGAGATVR